MPPRFAYWTIILEGKPTAFRAQHRDDLLPTFKQLQGKHPDIVMKWFARGRLWESPTEAQAVLRHHRERRPREWRPGGEHRDPRARFDVPRDEKRRRFSAKKRRDFRDRVDPQSDAFRGRPDKRGWNDRERPGNEGARKRPAWQRDRDRRPPHPAAKQPDDRPRSRKPSGQTQGGRGPGGPQSGPPRRDAKPKRRGGRGGGGGTGGGQPA
jgi:hypothetical protein